MDNMDFNLISVKHCNQTKSQRENQDINSTTGDAENDEEQCQNLKHSRHLRIYENNKDQENSKPDNWRFV